MSANERDLTALERAAIQQHIETQLAKGTYTSKAELRSDLRHSAMRIDGPLGELFRELQAQKMARTQEAGMGLLDNTRTVNRDGDAHFAIASRNAEGKVEARAVQIDEANGAKAPTSFEAAPRFQMLPGGTLRVALNSSTNGVPKDEAKPAPVMKISELRGRA